MSTALATVPTLDDSVLEMIVASGDLGKLTPHQRKSYLLALCESIGLNPLSRPIEFVSLNGKVVPYFKKDGTDQLRQLRKISITIVGREVVDGILTVTARASTPDGRCDEDFGSVVIANLKGEQAANATMKCITKAKRRVTLSICGLGFTDESELETIPNARVLTEEPIAPSPLQATIVTTPANDTPDAVKVWSQRMLDAEADGMEAVDGVAAACKAEIKDTMVLNAIGVTYVGIKRRLNPAFAAATTKAAQ